MENIEIEIQVKIENGKPLLEFLEKNAEFQGEKHQIDEYFSPVHRNFLEKRPIAEWLRLRNADGNFSINYKNWHLDKDKKSNYCDEYETKIESLDKVKKIFNVLDFKPVVTVDKIRKIYTYKDYEISIDSVKELGDFVEIEYMGDDEKPDPAKITQEMVNFLKELNLGKIEKNYVGYPFMLLFKDEVEFEVQ
jgi:adenylate cyclase class 2